MDRRRLGGRWIVARPIPGGFVFNIADVMQRLTEGRFVSTPHRVAGRTGQDRFSAPFFANPDYDAIITPIAREASGEPYEPLACGPLGRGRLPGGVAAGDSSRVGQGRSAASAQRVIASRLIFGRPRPTDLSLFILWPAYFSNWFAFFVPLLTNY
jgi:hypothetical protein